MRLILTLRRKPWRLASLILVALALLPPVGRPQSQDSQSESVAEAARRARENKKKAGARPAPVITDDDLKPATPQTVVSATAEQLRMPGSPPSDAQGKSGNVNAPAGQGSSAAATAGTGKAEKATGGLSAELTNVKEQLQVKQQLEAAQKDLDLLQRQLPLERDNYYSNPDYVHNTAGKAKLDALNQQISDRKQEVENLKAKLAALQEQQGSSSPLQP